MPTQRPMPLPDWLKQLADQCPPEDIAALNNQLTATRKLTDMNNQHVIDYRKNLMRRAHDRLKAAHAAGRSNSGWEYCLELRAIRWAAEVAAS